MFRHDAITRNPEIGKERKPKKANEAYTYIGQPKVPYLSYAAISPSYINTPSPCTNFSMIFYVEIKCLKNYFGLTYLLRMFRPSLKSLAMSRIKNVKQITVEFNRTSTALLRQPLKKEAHLSNK